MTFAKLRLSSFLISQLITCSAFALNGPGIRFERDLGRGSVELLDLQCDSKSKNCDLIEFKDNKPLRMVKVELSQGKGWIKTFAKSAKTPVAEKGTGSTSPLLVGYFRLADSGDYKIITLPPDPENKINLENRKAFIKLETELRLALEAPP